MDGVSATCNITVASRPASIVISCLVDGQCSFYDFLAYFNMEEVIPHTAYKTISGLILDELDHIPQTGEKLHWNRFTLEIVDMDGARIDKILVTPDTIPADENS